MGHDFVPSLGLITVTAEPGSKPSTFQTLNSIKWGAEGVRAFLEKQATIPCKSLAGYNQVIKAFVRHPVTFHCVYWVFARFNSG